ncbi:unnamed protein product [Orchesella dallaii]|uniref:Tudor domain-containing protein n=1 Tax=Orchesella dallaii TaxID=48710 RepID=A0ABP1Q9T2_9HEXA
MDNIERKKLTVTPEDTGALLAKQSEDDDTFSLDSNSSETYSVDSNFNDDIKQNDKEDNKNVTRTEESPTPEPEKNINPFLSSLSSKQAGHDREDKVVTALKGSRFRHPKVDSILKLRLVQQRPFKTTSKPLFELAERSEEYKTMEKRMLQVYKMLPAKHVLQCSQIFKGKYAVLMDVGGSAVYRIRFLSVPLGGVVSVEMIDYYVKREVDTRCMFYHLLESFAELPPRVTAIEMDGMSHYLNHKLFTQFVSHTSEQFLFDGDLTAVVQSNGKVVVYSDLIRIVYVHGINGYITNKFIKTLKEPKLPPLFNPKDDVYVVNAENNGVISLQMKSISGQHFQEIFDSCSGDRIQKLKGKVKLPETNLGKNEEKYFAPSKADAKDYRATILCRIDNENVRVHFIDYGDEAIVKIEDLVRCHDVHLLLALFPPQCIKVHLKNIQTLNADDYFKKYHSYDEPYTVQVVENVTDSLAEVVLWSRDSEKSLNQKIIEDTLGNPSNPSYKPESMIGYSDNWFGKFNLYVVLSGARRLSSGMELVVNVSHHASMSKMFFITPAEHDQRLREFETEIDTEYNLPWNSVSYLGSWVKGKAMLCYSIELRKVARALLVEEKVVNLPLGLDDGENETAKHCMRLWEVYLIDYGIREIISTPNFRMIMPHQIKTPAFGIRATCKTLDIQRKLQEWTSNYRTVQKTVVIQLIRKDRFGEIAQIVFK